MAIALDNFAIFDQAGGAGDLTKAFTMGVVSNGLIRVSFALFNDSGSTPLDPTTIQYGGQNLTETGPQQFDGSDISLFSFHLVNPPSGNNNLVINWAGTDNWAEGGIDSWSGVDQATPISNYTSTTGSSASPSLTVTSDVGKIALEVLNFDSAHTSYDSGQTEAWLSDNAGIGQGTLCAYENGASPSVAFANTILNHRWNIAGMSLNPAAGGVVTQGRVLLLH